MFFYFDDNKPKGKSFGIPSDFPVNEKYAEHYSNWIMLCFFQLQKEKFSLNERFRIEKEIDIAKRRMLFWSRMPGYDENISRNLIEGIKKKWEVDSNSALRDYLEGTK